ncbi:hypothetical protein B9G98_01883 [Wickerhamiella sorbophila]|uniref:DNA-directed RNA polymerase III subunit RPC4 n=1 Tax=Wickerhamiella sorbophila TaxID=45607 RepID=A0A2T0FGY4_9ASCO|nr:hypothetical protein B9G98_01883 [Wickerhamiella sorbophila]PRT54263.1 hypothetical protein B9G98_01883 [Wickerhamiella sorbophila]
MAEESNQPNDSPKPGRLESLSGRGSAGPGSSRPSRGRFTPNMVGRRSKEDRESTAPAIKPEPKNDVKKQEQQQRRKPRNNGARAEAAGPLAAPSTVDPRRSGRSGSGAGGGGGSASRTYSAATSSNAALSYELEDGGLDVGSTGIDRPFFPIRAQKSVSGSEQDEQDEFDKIPELEEDKLYLFELPALEIENTDEMTDSEKGIVEGQIGTLQYHESGRVTLLIGNTAMDVYTGANVTSIEDVALMEPETVSRLGQIDERFVVVPDVSQY